MSEQRGWARTDPQARYPQILMTTARLTAREYAFFGLGLLFWAGFVILLGKDTSWDFRNYHWYAPYALLHHRMGIDVAVAHQASYYNPYLDVPRDTAFSFHFYRLAREMLEPDEFDMIYRATKAKFPS